jgi:hypothetical protein
MISLIVFSAYICKSGSRNSDGFFLGYKNGSGHTTRTFTENIFERDL